MFIFDSPLNCKCWSVMILCLAGCGGSYIEDDLNPAHSARAVTIQINPTGVSGISNITPQESRAMKLRVWVDEAHGPPLEIGRGLVTAASFLPLELTESPLCFDVILQIPVDAFGRLFRFELIPADVECPSARPETTLCALSALSNNPFFDSNWKVNISLASSLAYETLVAIEQDLDSSLLSRWAGYRALEAMYLEAHHGVEAEILPAKRASIELYSRQIQVLLKGLVASVVDLQRQLATALCAICKEGCTHSAKQSLLPTFAKLLNSFRLRADEPLYIRRTNTSAEVLPHFASAPNDVLYALAPTQVSLIDTDPTDRVGGTVLLSAAEVSLGIHHYQIYLGGKSLPTARKIPLGRISQVSPPMLLNISPSVAVESGVTHVWAFASDGVNEWGEGKSASFVNYRL